MTIGIVQLKVHGKQDNLLTYEPSLDLLDNSYKQYTNVSSAPYIIKSLETVDFGKLINFFIPPNGDYLSKMYFELTLPPLIKQSGTYASWTQSIGFAILEYITLFIDENEVDKHYPIFMDIWHELSNDQKNMDTIVGKLDSHIFLKRNAENSTKYKIPLNFWFCKNYNQALPIFLMTYSKVKVQIKLSDFDKCIIFDGNTPPTTVNITEGNLNVEYLYIDHIEKKKLIGKKENDWVLFEQVQTRTVEEVVSGINFKAHLPFNLPCKEILWVFRELDSYQNNDHFNYSRRNLIVDTPILPLMKTAKFYIENNVRIDTLNEDSFRTLNSHKYHKNTTDRYIYCIPFCLYPEDKQPSGTLNFSAIDDPIIYIEMWNSISASNLYAFAVNYNWYKIENGIFKVYSCV